MTKKNVITPEPANLAQVQHDKIEFRKTRVKVYRITKFGRPICILVFSFQFLQLPPLTHCLLLNISNKAQNLPELPTLAGDNDHFG